MKLAAGRWLNEADEQEASRSGPDSLKHYSLVLNETAVKALGFRSPEEALGHQVRFGINQISAPVVGVVKDYHIASLHTPVKPVIMLSFPFFYYNAGIRLAGGYSPATMDAIRQAFTEVYPRQLYEAKFLDEDIAAQYKEEERTRQLFNLFTGLSIAINVLGLVGLLAFMIEQKTKEVGIRKVLGAGAGDISFLLSKDFLRLIGIAFLAAAPLTGLHHGSLASGFCLSHIVELVGVRRRIARHHARDRHSHQLPDDTRCPDESHKELKKRMRNYLPAT